MTKPVARIEHERGETISFGLRTVPYLPEGEVDSPENYVDTPFDGNETVTCAVKKATNKETVPAADVAAEFSVASVWYAAVGDATPYWLFTITPVQSAALSPDLYVTDAKIVYASGAVVYPAPILINVSENVTA